MAMRNVAATLSVSFAALAASGALANMAAQPVSQYLKKNGTPAHLAAPDVNDPNPHRFNVYLSDRSGNGAAAVVQYFASFGFKAAYDGRLNSVGVEGTYAQAQAAGHFTYVLHGTGENAFLLPDRRPSFAGPVQKAVAHTTFYLGPRLMPMNAVAQPRPEDFRSHLPTTGFGPADYATFYNITPVYEAGINGKGQVVDIAACGTVWPADLEFFSEYFGIPYKDASSSNPTLAPPIPIDVPTGGSVYYSAEPTLDMERVHGTAPGASIHLYYVPDCTVNEWEDMYAQIEADNQSASTPAAALTISYGQYEGVLNAEEAACAGGNTNYANYCNYLANADVALAGIAATGVTIFAASGDSGGWLQPSFFPTGIAYPYPTIHADVMFPASDSNVIAVGGTTVFPNGANTVEWAWSGNIGTGGGVSTTFGAPSWQISALGLSANARKQVPDVADLADPYPGAAFVFCTVQCGTVAPSGLGGTSASSPTMAGVLALIDAARAAKGTKLLPKVAAKFYSHMGDFRDITVGSNGPWVAGPGYDHLTGIGSPNVGKLVSDLQ